MRTPVLTLVLGAFALQAADPKDPVLWKAERLKEYDKSAASKLNPERHLGTERLMDSAFLLYRNGPSEGEIHIKDADFIVFREGEGIVLIGGKLVNGKDSAPGEMRGPSIEGGTKYTVKAGDSIYVPANTPHQFQVEPGKSFTAIIIKVTPKP